MISPEIQTLLNNNSIEPSPLSLKGVEIKIEKADRLYNFANKNLSGLGTGDEDIVINAAAILLNGELGNEFQRFQQMRKKRNRIEYGDFIGISEAELSQAHIDARVLLTKVKELQSALEMME